MQKYFLKSRKNSALQSKNEKFYLDHPWTTFEIPPAPGDNLPNTKYHLPGYFHPEEQDAKTFFEILKILNAAEQKRSNFAEPPLNHLKFSFRL